MDFFSSIFFQETTQLVGFDGIIHGENWRKSTADISDFVYVFLVKLSIFLLKMDLPTGALIHTLVKEYLIHHIKCF